MTAVRILLNSYTGLFNFLNEPERQWLSIIDSKAKELENYGPNLPFPDVRGPNFECQRTIVALRASIND